MSGGHFNYICFTLDNECGGQMQDDELNEMLKDFFDVLHDLEWWQSGDIGEYDYRKTVKAFKKKWFCQTNDERIEKAIKTVAKNAEKQLREWFGIGE